MNFRRRSYFWRLLYAFFAGGLVPFILLAVLFGTASSRILETAYRSRTAESVTAAAGLSRALIAEASSIASELASSEAVLAWLANETRDDAWQASEVNRLFSSSIASSFFIPYIIPFDGDDPLTRGSVPDEYRIALYGGWGILGELSRRMIGPGETVVYGQPHPESGSAVPLAAGAIAYADGIAAGYVVVDVDRRLFADRLGTAAASGGALTDLMLVNDAGCILYSMSVPRAEGSFVADSGGTAASRNDSPGAAVFYASEQTVPGFSVNGSYPVSAARSYSGKITRSAVLIAFCSIAVSLLMAVLLSRSIAKPVHELTETMERVSQGQLDARAAERPGRRGPHDSESGDELSFLVHRFNVTLDQVNALVDNLVAQERDLRRAETQALQAQINPHFLYNTLNSIRSMAKLSGSPEIASMTTSLARILREGALPGGSFSTVEESLSIARDYFSIESMRWPGRFKMEEYIDPAILGAKIPRLILQPLVENALVHGLEQKSGEGSLEIHGTLSAGDVFLRVRDSGSGIEPLRLAQIRERLREAGERPVESSLNDSSIPVRSEGAGIALVNTHRRLCLMFGKPYGIEISSDRGIGTTVVVCFPFLEAEG